MSSDRPKAKYVPSVSPRLRVVLHCVFAMFAILAVGGVYLAGVTFLQWTTGNLYEGPFYQSMFLIHLGVGLLLIPAAVGFGFLHMLRARNRKNRRAVRIGYGLLTTAMLILLSGILLMRIGSLVVVESATREIIYWLHIITPLAGVWLYWLHRMVGPKIRWYLGRRIAIGSMVVIGMILAIQLKDPRTIGAVPKEGDKYFQPSLARTATGRFIPADRLMNDAYCLACHEEIHNSWIHSAHRFSSFNNPAYLATIRETRAVALQRDGNVKATRFCAGCHDAVPFFSGAFDDPDFDDVNHPTAQAGITCTVCHAIQSLGSTKGNADFVIDQPQHYLFAYSKNPVLRALNHQMVKAKPAFHKKEMLKPFHKTAEFCSTCHKVHLPGELTAYREFLRGQNHYDSYLLSGVSGHGTRSFYYPDVAQESCNGCHMPEIAPSSLANNLAAKTSPTSGQQVVKSHFFPGANTAVPFWAGDDEAVGWQKEFLENCVRVDIFGIRDGRTVEDQLIAPLRPEIPTLQPGKTYLIEVVIRTLALGHHFTQGTTDSNQIWLDIEALQGEQRIGESGQISDGVVDPWAHYVNTFMLDKDGNRIDRRNAQDIFVPLYSHQIPPGAAQTVHYRLTVPEESPENIRLRVALKYRKFDTRYMKYIQEAIAKDGTQLRDQDSSPNPLPITVLADDEIVLPVGQAETAGDAIENQPNDIPVWQRWNDYGIGMLLKGKAELRQASDAFTEVERLGRYDGPINLARAMFAEGDLDGATEALGRAAKMDPPPPPWTFNWLSGIVDRQQGNLENAERSLRGAIESKVPSRKFDFSLDYVVRNELALALLDLSDREENRGDQAAASRYLDAATSQFQQVLDVDSENVTAHANLAQIYNRLGDTEKSAHHSQLHKRYKPDDNAAELAQPAARLKYPAANKAAEDLVIYELQPTDAKE